MRHWFIRGPLMVLLFLCFSADAQEELLTVRVKGSADGQGYRAKTLAVQDAQFGALKEVLVRLAPAFDMNVLRPIFRNAQAYLADYDILRHEHVQGRTEVEVEVRLRERLLRQDTALFLLPRIPVLPKVLLVIGEQFPKDKVMGVIEYGVVEVTLTEQLEKQGFKTVVGVESLNGLYSQKALIAAVMGDVDGGREFARQQVAEVVVVGRTVAAIDKAYQGGGAELHRMQAVLDLQIYRSMDGRLLETVQTMGVVTGESLEETTEAAMVDAGIKATTGVIVAAALAKLDAPREQGVLITLEAPGSRAIYGAVLKRLHADPRSVLVEEVFYSDKLARIRVHYEEGIGTLVDVLESGMYEGKQGYVTRAVGKEMSLVFRD